MVLLIKTQLSPQGSFFFMQIKYDIREYFTHHLKSNLYFNSVKSPPKEHVFSSQNLPVYYIRYGVHGSSTSVLMTRGLFPRLSRKCRGDSIVPNSWRSPNFSLSVSVVAEMPASGPRLGKEPAVTEGSGICPGIVSDSVFTTAMGGRGGKWETQ